jgi:hypothetical protein
VLTNLLYGPLQETGILLGARARPPASFTPHSLLLFPGKPTRYSGYHASQSHPPYCHEP